MIQKMGNEIAGLATSFQIVKTATVGKSLIAAAHVDSRQIERKARAGPELPLRLIAAAQSLHVNAETVTQSPAPGLFHVHQKRFRGFVPGRICRSKLHRIKQPEVVQAPLRIKNFGLTHRLATLYFELPTNDARPRIPI